VEGALVLSIVLFTLIGIVDVGQVLFSHQALAERLRVGARWGAVNTYDVAKIRNVVIYNTPNPAGGAKPILGLSSDMVQVTLTGAGGPEARIEVRIVNYPFRLFTPLIQGVYQAQRLRISMPVEGLGTGS
jgi:hypothetical protein